MAEDISEQNPQQPSHLQPFSSKELSLFVFTFYKEKNFLRTGIYIMKCIILSSGEIKNIFFFYFVYSMLHIFNLHVMYAVV